MERDNLMAALKEARGKVTGHNGAAALLGVNPNTLASRLRALGLKKAFADTASGGGMTEPNEASVVEGYTDSARN
jgi:hypothetical protein